MDLYQVISTDETVQVTFDKKIIPIDDLQRILSRLHLEYLARLVNFDATIEDLGKEIKHNWWQANKNRFIKEDEL
jgi:hypothetical protein